MRDILKIIFVIVGTFIGAGFASGQEINVFFFSYGIKGFFGLILSISLIGVIIYKTLFIAWDNNIKSYKEFLMYIFRIKRKNSFFIEIINIIINLFILSIFFIMIAGFGAYFKQEFGINSLFRKRFIIYFMFYNSY